MLPGNLLRHLPLVVVEITRAVVPIMEQPETCAGFPITILIPLNIRPQLALAFGDVQFRPTERPSGGVVLEPFVEFASASECGQSRFHARAEMPAEPNISFSNPAVVRAIFIALPLADRLSLDPAQSSEIP